MKIQSLSIAVPGKKCINSCKFCVSGMHDESYEDMISGKNLYYDLYQKDYLNRLQYARDNGCNTLMITGDIEPLQNWAFLKELGTLNKMLASPFKTIEIQTAGNLITDDYLYFLRHHVGVTTISLSLSSIFSSHVNSDLIGCSLFSIDKVCKSIKKYRFNLRLSLNMNINMLFPMPTDDLYDDVAHIFNQASENGADQVTFRELFFEGDTEQAKWTKENCVTSEFWEALDRYIKSNGKAIDKLEYGRTKYDVGGIGVVVDGDCMSKDVGDVAKYLILRPDCKLYSKWDSKASLIF